MVRGLMARKTCSVSPSTVLVPLLAIRNCWLLALNIAVAHGLLHSMWKLHGCFVLVKKLAHGFERACFTLAKVTKPVLQGTQVCNLMPEAQNER